jgi:penicillin amidase
LINYYLGEMKKSYLNILALKTSRVAPVGLSKLKLLLMVLIIALSASCSLFAPLPAPTNFETRASLPANLKIFSTKTEIYWDSNLVPFIETQDDLDLARALGVLHAHLRLGQMELYRRIVKGKISEIAGPLAVELDQALRVLALDKAATSSIAGIDDETKEFLQAYVQGINAYQNNLDELPFEFRFGNISKTEWTIEDVIGITKLAGVDINWLVWAGLLDNLEDPNWSKFWNLITENYAESVPSFDILNLDQFSRFGSNAFAVAGKSTSSGKGLLAADPHVGFALPNLWLICSFSSPSFKSGGMMLPGLPIVLIGRNEQIAWGATNMRSMNSRMFELQDTELNDLQVDSSPIEVRWWFDSESKVRSNKYGNIISDIERINAGQKTLALKWIGTEASNEIGALLKVMKSKNWSEFQDAFEDYAVSGQNYLYADKDGNIGQLAATRVPQSQSDFSEGFLQSTAADWSLTFNAKNLPKVFNPAQNFVASSNNPPFKTTERENYQIGIVFSGDDRINRLKSELSGYSSESKFDASKAKALMLDVYSDSNAKLNNLLISKAEVYAKDFNLEHKEILELLKSWDGNFNESSKSALVYNIFAYSILKELFISNYGEDLGTYLLKSDSAASIAIRILPTDLSKESVQKALAFAAEKSDDFDNWGEFHKMRVQHLFGNIPVLGARFRIEDFPVSGSGTTLFKTFSGFTEEEHYSRYGTNSRFVFDLAQDHSFEAILLGGQDGWFNSPYFNNQTDLWREGKFIEVAFDADSARAKALKTQRLDYSE